MRFLASLDQLPYMMGLVEKSLHRIKGSSKEKYQLQLSLEEALVNIIKYAYPEKPGDVEILYEWPDANCLIITIKDWGAAFNPTHFIPRNQNNLSVEERPIGGLGIYLMLELMDKVDYERKEGANILTLTKIFKNQ